MEQEQTWNDCKYSGRPQCKYKNEDLIRKYNESIPDAIISQDAIDPNPITSEMTSRIAEINNQFCKDCDTFQLWPEEHTHDKCKHFSYQKCPHINDDIMKRKSAGLQETFGGSYVEVSFPTDEETNEICKKCDTFAPK